MSNTNLVKNGAIAAAVSVVFGASVVNAETINTTVSATIQTGFTFTETQTMNFGTIAVLKTIGAADIMVSMNETTGVRATTDSAQVALIAGGGEQNLILDVTNAPPFTVLALTPIADVNLGLGTNPDILLGTFVEDGGGLTTDAAGALNLQYGGTLAFSNAAVYGAGTYTGVAVVTLDFP